MQKRVAVRTSAGSIQIFQVAENEDFICINGLENNNIPNIEIPEEIFGLPVQEIGNECFLNHREIESISLPETLQKIGHGAFRMCKGLREIVVPDGVTKIGARCFQDCTGLQRVILPKNLETISYSLFAFCNFQPEAQVHLPAGLKLIGHHAFYHCEFLKLVIPPDVEKIQVGAFVSGPHNIVFFCPPKPEWFLEWPCGAKVILADGTEGRVCDIRPLHKNVSLLSVETKNDTRRVFFPSVSDMPYVFASPFHEQRHQKLRDNYGLEAEETYWYWLHGYL